MTITEHRPPGLGTGIYTIPEAARYLKGAGRAPSIDQIRGWVRSGLVPAAAPTDHGVLLDFLDVVSIEIIRRLRAQGVSTQGLRRAAETLRDQYQLEHPFAHRVFYTHRGRLWAKIDAADPVELLGKLPGHGVIEGAVAACTERIAWDDSRSPAVASRLELVEGVTMDPAIQFGAPVVTGTRIPVSVLRQAVEQAPVEEVASWYGLSALEVGRAVDYARAAA